MPPAPFVSQPASGNGANAEGDKTCSGIWNEFSVTDLPLLGERKGSGGGKYQEKKMIQKVPNIKKQHVGRGVRSVVLAHGQLGRVEKANNRLQHGFMTSLPDCHYRL